MDNANPNTGAEPLTVDTAAQRILGILEPKEPEAKTEAKASTPELEVEKEDSPDFVPDETPEAEGTEAKPETQELSFENLQQLAEALEVPFDDLMEHVKARVKVAGEERDVTLKELRDGYQMEADYRKKTSELSEHRKAFEAERDRVANEINARFQEAQQISTMLENQLMAEYQAVNWNELRATNPAEFAALKQEYNERYNHIQNVKANVAQNLQAQQNELKARQDQELQQMIVAESERLQAVIPEFRDKAKADALKAQLREYLKADGYSDQEIKNVYDHRHVKYLRKAMLYDAMQSKKPELTKKVVNLPKMQKPGSAKSKADIKSERVNQKLAKLRKSGNTHDLASILMEKL